MLEFFKGIIEILDVIVSVVGIVIFIALTSLMFFVHTRWGERMLRKRKPTDDPCGNPNINKKPWDYM